MIRPNEITHWIFNDVEYWLIKNDFQEIEISENKINIFIKAKKSYERYLFNVDIKYNDATRIVHCLVHCLTPVPKEKRMFCLKLLNYISLYDEELKYILCPFNHIISCSTAFSIFDSCLSIGESTYFWISELILNITNVHLSIKHDDVRICDLNPIRFYNYL